MSNSTRREGTPSPLGVSIVDSTADFVESGTCAWNFALTSRHASGVELLLYGAADAAKPLLSRTLDIVENRTGLVWHCRVPMVEAEGAQYYGYRVRGPREESSRSIASHAHRFDPQKILLDPFARAVYFPKGFSREAAKGAGANDGRAPLGVLPRAGDAFAWGEDAPIRHGSDLIIYELHVRGFTMDESSGVPLAKRGTFAGLVEKIPYLKELGVTAVELLPVFQFDPQEGNYWGYMPISFFAVHGQYAMGGGDWAALDEFRAMVRAMHRAGIEVFVDCVHNHTGEGGASDVTYSQKGIDNASYYAIGDSPEKPYVNYSGTGNSIDGNSGIARQLLIESLRYWIEVMRVDGIRHDLASVVMRGSRGDLPEQPAAAIAATAVRELASVRHIVEPWDAVGAYQLGSAFPLRLAWQWNGKFRDDVRRFVRGDHGLVGAMMQRMYGSDDLFPEVGLHSYRPIQSVNFITAHDGFTMYDLVSYTAKRNEANGHLNTDGSDNEHSWNCGTEGDEGLTPELMARRKRAAKNLCAMLMLSAGTPMLRAGDEFLQTQRGNNNAYNQDNATSWLDWNRRKQFPDVWAFFQGLIAFRKNHPSLGRSRFWRQDVRWHGVTDGINWDEPSRSFAYFLDGARVNDDDLYVMVNMHDARQAYVPQEPGEWRLAFDTSLDWMATPGGVVPASVEVDARAIVVLVRAKNSR
jgi:glycogen operon protein